MKSSPKPRFRKVRDELPACAVPIGCRCTATIRSIVNRGAWKNCNTTTEERDRTSLEVRGGIGSKGNSVSKLLYGEWQSQSSSQQKILEGFFQEPVTGRGATEGGMEKKEGSEGKN